MLEKQSHNRKIAIIAIILFFLAVLPVAAIYCTILHWSTSSLVIENQTGSDIHTLVALWPDGGVTRFRGTLPQNGKTTMKHVSKSEGGAKIFFKTPHTSQWYHVNSGGYTCYALGTETEVIISELHLLKQDNVPLPP